MTPKLKKIVKQLSAVAGTEELVRVRRGIRGSDRVEGFVVSVGAQWVLLNVFDPDMFLDGYAALRVSDVRRVEPRGGTDSFPVRALRHFGEFPSAPEGVDLDTIEGLLASVGSRYPLLLIHVEGLDPEVCYVGRYRGTSKRKLRLLEISPRATWDEKPTKWPLKAITRVEFETRYSEALQAVGGEPTRRDGERFMLFGGHSVPPEPYRTIQFETFWRDRLWFEANPAETECRRDYVDGEFWPLDEAVDRGSIEYVSIRMADFLGQDRGSIRTWSVHPPVLFGGGDAEDSTNWKVRARDVGVPRDGPCPRCGGKAADVMFTEDAPQGASFWRTCSDCRALTPIPPDDHT